MQIKKIFNLEEVLTSDDFIAQKQDAITIQYQRKYSGLLVKVYTYCKEDRKIVISITEESKTFVGSSDKTLAHRLIDEQSLLSLDNEMTDTYELIITTDTALPDYVTAIDVAQAKADEKFDSNKSLLPIITVVDYRWGNPVTLVLPTVFGDTDVDGNLIPPDIGNPLISIGDKENGKTVLDDLKNVQLFQLNRSNNFLIKDGDLYGNNQILIQGFPIVAGSLSTDYIKYNGGTKFSKFVDTDSYVKTLAIIDVAGYLHVAGDNGNSRLGLGTEFSTVSDVNTLENTGINNIKYAHFSQYDLSIIKKDGTVWMCGRNLGYSHGLDTTVPTPELTLIPNINNAVKVRNSRDATFILNDLGELYSCGSKRYNGFANDNTVHELLYTGVKDIISSLRRTIVIFNDGSVKTIGYVFDSTTIYYNTEKENYEKDILDPLVTNIKTGWAYKTITFLQREDGTVIKTNGSGGFVEVPELTNVTSMDITQNHQLAMVGDNILQNLNGTVFLPFNPVYII